MALTTRNARASACYPLLPFRGILPAPDGTVDQGDRQTLLVLYSVVFAPAPPPAPPPVVLHIPGGVSIQVALRQLIKRASGGTESIVHVRAEGAGTKRVPGGSGARPVFVVAVASGVKRASGSRGAGALLGLSAQGAGAGDHYEEIALLLEALGELEEPLEVNAGEVGGPPGDS